jgi:hypothetical protein
VTVHLFVRGDGMMIAAPVQCDVDGVPKGSHYVLLKPPNEKKLSDRRRERAWLRVKLL